MTTTSTTTTTMRNILAMIGLTAVIASITTTIMFVMGSSVSPNDNDVATDRHSGRDDATDADDDNDGNPAAAGRNDKVITAAGDKTTSCAAINDIADLNSEFSHHPDDENLYLYHFDETSSTQDEAKIIAEELAGSTSTRSSQSHHTLPSFVVSATSQTNGRGTSGRQWLGAPGNIFVTIGIPQSSWLRLQNKNASGSRYRSSRTGSVPLTLLPLKVGTEVAKLISDKLNDSTICRHRSSSSSSPPRVTVKWPNDVLVDERKISGTLIESSQHGDYFLIGIGINLKYKPTIPTSGPNHGRPATSFEDFCDFPDVSSSENQISWEDLSRKWSVQLAYNLYSWLTSHSSLSVSTTFVTPNNNNSNSVDLAQSIVDGWKEWLDWDMELVMRDTAAQERVKLVNVLPDGRVEVEVVDDRTNNGPRRTLVSDYFL